MKSTPPAIFSAAPLRRAARRLLIVALAVAVLVALIRVVLDPIAAHETRQALAQARGIDGDFQSVHVSVFPPGYTITHLKLIQTPGGDWRAPLLYAGAVHVGLDWRQLLHGRIAAGARIVEPKITVVSGAEKAPKENRPAKTPDLSAPLANLTPLKIDRVEVVRGEFLFRDLGEPGHPELWLHHVEVAAENLPTREKMLNGRPTTVNASGTVGKTGKMTLFVSADPFASPLAFAGRFQLAGLHLAELFSFLEPKSELQTPSGTIDLFAEFLARDGRIEGGVKPLLKNVKVSPADSGVWTRVKAWLVDKTVKLASDRVPERNAVATRVPIEGRLTNPDVQLWPAIVGVIRNAFVEGVASGFAQLPPAVAPEKEGVLEQAKHALAKDKGPPKAQPTATTAGRSARSK